MEGTLMATITSIDPTIPHAGSRLRQQHTPSRAGGL
jgi:hypothetical protein